MCWSEPVSWASFIIGTIVNAVCASLTNAKHRLWFVLFQSVMTVQLGEALIWHEPEGTLGNIGSYIVFFSIWLQPIIIVWLLASYGISTPILYGLVALLLVYAASSIESIKHLARSNYKPVICDSDNKHHIYFNDMGDVTSVLYGAIIVLFLIKLFPQFPYITGFLVATYAISQIFYKDMLGSMWCWFSVASPAVFYLTQGLPVLTSWSQIANNYLK